MTKGGVIIGRTERTLIRRRARNRVRVTMSTKHSASSVAEDAVISPSCSVFQTMPPYPQILLLAKRESIAASEKLPAGSRNACRNMRVIG